MRPPDLCRLRGIVLLFVALFPIFNARGEIISESARDFLLSRLKTEIGPVVPRASSPELYDSLEQEVLKLQRAREQTQNEKVNSLGAVYILNSPKHFAFTLAKTADGTRKEEQLVFITTGALRDLYEGGADAKAEPNAHQLGMLRIVAALAPTIAHPFAFEKAGGHYFHSQEHSLIADQLGIGLLRQIGYPVEASLAAKDIMDERGEAPSSNRAARLRSPEKNLALAAERISLTLGRYERGVQQAPILPQPPAHLSTEIAALDPEKELRFVPPPSMAEATKDLRALLQSVDEKNRLKINQLVLWVDHHFYERGEQVTPRDLSELHDFLSLLAKKQMERNWLYSSEEARRFINARNTPSELVVPFGHRDYMKRIPAYRRPEHLKWISENFIDKAADWVRKNPDGTPAIDVFALNPLTSLAPLQSLASVYAERLAKTIPVSDPHDFSAGPRLGAYPVFRGHENDPEYQSVFGAALYREYFRKLTPKQRITFFFERPLLHWDPLTFHREGDGNERPATPEDTLAIERQHADEIWRDRGFWGTMEFANPSAAVDWDSIWKILGITADVGKRQLNEAVRKFTSSPEYAQYLQAITEIHDTAANALANGRALRATQVPWADDSLLPYLLGDKVGAIKKNPALRLVATGLAKTYLGPKRAPIRALLERKLDEAFKGRKSMTADEAKALAAKLSMEIYGVDEATHEGEELSWAKAIRRSGLAPGNKAALLKDLFLSDGNLFPPYSWIGRSPETAAVASELVSGGVAPSFFDLAMSRKPKSEYSAPVPPVYQAITALRTDILRELNRRVRAAPTAQAKTKVLKDFVESLLFNGDEPKKYESQSHGPIPELESKEIGQFKAAILSMARKAGVSEVDQIALARRLAITGKAPEIDRFFLENFGKDVEGPDDTLLSEATAKALFELLKEGTIVGAVAQGKLARAVLERRIRQLQKKGATRPEVEAVLQDIETMAPKGSQIKDGLLESVGLRLGLRQNALRALVEEQKSGNWKKQDPMFANLGSAVSHELQKLSRPALLQTLDYLLDTRAHSAPSELAQTIERSIYDDLVADEEAKIQTDSAHSSGAGAAGRGIDYQKLKEQAHTRSNDLLKSLQSELVGAAPTDRIPFVELLMNSGEKPLAADSDYPLLISRKYLKYKPDSIQEKMLIAFLKIVPEHEKTPSVAYLLSQAGHDKSSIRPLFEVFQTVGIKFGQISSVWELFGPKIAKETAGLKENARKLTVAEIEEVLVQDLGAKRAEHVRIVDIMGCGGIACSVKIEYLSNSGKWKKGVVLVKRPNAEAQIKGNIALTKEFLAALKAEGVDFPDGVYEDMLRDLDSQLMDELDFRKVADHLLQAKKDFEELNHEMKATLGPNLHFAVPDLLSDFADGNVHENLLFMDFADGSSWEKLVHEEKDPKKAEAIRERFGLAIQESNLRRFFRKGRFNADVHGGNVLIDPASGTIFPIDFGQDEAFTMTAPWQQDELGLIADFFKEVNAGHAEGTLSAALAMGKKEAPPSAIQKAKLLQEIRALFSGAPLPPEKKLLELRAIFARNGLRLERKFSFGMMKGLLIEAREGYVSQAKFASLLEREVTRTVIRKLPHTLLRRVRGAFGLGPKDCDFSPLSP